MNSTTELAVIIICIVVAVGIAGMYFGGQAMHSTGSDMINQTQNSPVLAWAGVPVGSFLMDTGISWAKTAESITMFIVAIFFIASLLLYVANKPR